MKWETLSKADCEGLVASISPNFQAERLSDEYKKIREGIKSIVINVKSEHPNAREYEFDLAVAVPLYILLTKEFGMNERIASNDGVWRYLSLKVVPDVVLTRWGYKEARFWKESRRIWLKVLWWYIYLSWQGNEKDTYNTLIDNTTDIVVQLVERPGPQGYRVETCRVLMKRLCELKYSGNKAEVFRKIMVLNTARLKVVEPGLFEGGEGEYIGQLFDYFSLE